MTENRVVIFSNGIADFQRTYQVRSDQPERISLPVRQDHLADLLASFNVYGNVTLQSPPTFCPANQHDGSVAINPQQVWEDLAAHLSGAAVRVERGGGVIEGKLVGLHQEEEGSAGEPVTLKSLIISTAQGLCRCLLREIQSWQFLEEEIRREIDKALARNYQRIKPKSTYVELVLTASEASTQAVVQYTLPAAAWKISYRLRLREGEPGQLQGFAIVDNNTDEDWTDFLVSVVSGEPITFSTDLAESKTPRRSRVDLVSASALGAVEVEDSPMVMAAGDDVAYYELPAPERRALAKNRKRLAASTMLEPLEMDAADTSSTTAHEVGDFSVFSSESAVTIPAQRSTVIPMFTVDLSDSRSVLHYKHENHSTRPYRSIDFTNQAGFALARGVATVYAEGIYAGSCIMPALKPAEHRLLPHALETGVSVRQEQPAQQSKVIALRLAAGFCYSSNEQVRKTHYHLKNSRDEAFEFVLDHSYALQEPELTAQLSSATETVPLAVATPLAEGVRFALTLPPHSQQVVHVVERRIAQSKVTLVTNSQQHESQQIEWLQQHLIKTGGPLSKDPGVHACLQVFDELEAKRQETADAQAEIERLNARQERLRQNIKSGGQDELTSRWRNELDQAEQAIKALEETAIPRQRGEEKELRAKLKESLRALSAEWSEAAQ